MDEQEHRPRRRSSAWKAVAAHDGSGTATSIVILGSSATAVVLQRLRTADPTSRTALRPHLSE